LMKASGSPIGAAPAAPVNVAAATKADTARIRSEVDIVGPLKVGAVRPLAYSLDWLIDEMLPLDALFGVARIRGKGKNG
jgi:hypothetical protein